MYLGVHGGYLKGDTADAGGSLSLKGALGGGHAGYLMESGRAVFGIEGDVSASAADYQATAAGITLAASIDFLASVRGRIGINAGPAILYATGGVAVASGTMKATGFGASASVDISTTGYVFGGGAEAKINERASVRVEALRYGFSELRVAGTNFDTKLNATVVRGGISWHFN